MTTWQDVEIIYQRIWSDIKYHTDDSFDSVNDHPAHWEPQYGEALIEQGRSRYSRPTAIVDKDLFVAIFRHLQEAYYYYVPRHFPPTDEELAPLAFPSSDSEASSPSDYSITSADQEKLEEPILSSSPDLSEYSIAFAVDLGCPDRQ